MASGDGSTMETRSSLELTLLGLHNFLSVWYQTVKDNEERNKALVTHLADILSKACVKKKESGDPSEALPQNSVNKESEVLSPELEESEKLLQKCKLIKEDFHSPGSTARLSKPQKPLESRKHIPTHRNSSKPPNKANKQTRRMPSNETKCASDFRKTKRIGVITESRMQQLNELMKPERKELEPSPLCRAPAVAEGSSRQKLLEKNIALKEELETRLIDGPTPSGLTFVETIESSLCQDCSQFHAEGISSSEMKDVEATCALSSQEQFSEFYSSVRNYLEQHVFPVFLELKNNNEIPSLIYQDLLQLGFQDDLTT